MADFIDSVADLIDIRDKDNLESTLAGVLFEIVEASTLLLWRLVRDDGQIRMRERVRLQSANSFLAPSGAMIGPINSPELDAHPELREAYETKLYVRRPRDENGMYSHVFPIADGDEVIGLLDVLRPTPLSQQQEKLVFGVLRIYRSHLGVLDYSDTDELTGLSNRRPFDEAFRRIANAESAGSNRLKDSVSRTQLAVVDVDFFKRINDQFGHPYGDEVLVLLTRVMRDSFRETDRLFRFGGEEFLVILADANPDEAETLLERFRRRVEGHAFPQVGRVTVSIGVTSVCAGDAGSHAFGRADEALYVAKQQGRNQLRRYEQLVADGTLAPAPAAAQDIDLF